MAETLTPEMLRALAMMQNPALAQSSPAASVPQLTPEQETNRWFQEGAAMADPFAVSGLTRMFGGSIPQQIMINEEHGLANKEQQRYLDVAKALRRR